MVAMVDLTRQIKYMLGDPSPSEELGRLMREVVAVVVQQVISVRSCFARYGMDLT